MDRVTVVRSESKLHNKVFDFVVSEMIWTG